MPKALQDIRQKASNDTYASVVHSFGEANQDLRALAVESVRRSFEIQSQFVSQAYATYFSELAKLGRLLFPGHSIFTPRSPEQPHANVNEKKFPIDTGTCPWKPRWVIRPPGNALPPKA